MKNNYVLTPLLVEVSKLELTDNMLLVIKSDQISPEQRKLIKEGIDQVLSAGKTVGILFLGLDDEVLVIERSE